MNQNEFWKLFNEVDEHLSAAMRSVNPLPVTPEVKRILRANLDFIRSQVSDIGIQNACDRALENTNELESK